MKKIFCFLLVGIVGLNMMYAQDNKAKTILDKVSAKNKEYKSIAADFSYSLDNKEEDIHEVSEGKIILKNNKYKLSLMGTDIYFDGNLVYTHLIDAEEVSIKEPDEDEQETLNPAKIFSIYENGFTYKYVTQKTIQSKTYHIIDLFPTDSEKSFSSIRLQINSQSNQIEKLISFGKDGNNVSIKLNKITPNIELKESDFVFNSKANPDVEIVDMR